MNLQFGPAGQAHRHQPVGPEEDSHRQHQAGDAAEIKHAVAATYYKLEVDGRLIYEIDMIAAIQVIDGVDQLAEMRTALGL